MSKKYTCDIGKIEPAQKTDKRQDRMPGSFKAKHSFLSGIGGVEKISAKSSGERKVWHPCSVAYSALHERGTYCCTLEQLAVARECNHRNHARSSSFLHYLDRIYIILLTTGEHHRTLPFKVLFHLSYPAFFTGE